MTRHSTGSVASARASEEKKGSDGVTVTTGQVHEHERHVRARDADAAIKYATGVEYTPGEGKRLVRKLDRHLLPLMMILYLIQFMDKVTLGNSTLLGLKTDLNLTQNEYNWCSSVFYISYLVFQWPQTVALQRLPTAKWMGVNIVVWGIALSLHAVCHSFAGLFVVRFILGVCEGTMTSGMLLVTSMFYNRTEHGTRTAFWFLMNGTAQIVSGLLAYGVHHVNNSSIKQWQVFYVITGLITFVFGIAWMFLFPDNPHTAWFFDENERHVAVERLRSNQSGIENKRWKKGQFAEALTDIKVWLFFFFSAIDNIPNALTVQVQQVYVELGFSTLTSTLLNIPSGCIEITTLLIGATLLHRFPNARSWIAMGFFLPNLLGAILVVSLPWSNKIGILCSIFVTGFGTTGFVIAISWLQVTTAGHTKKTTAQAMNLIGYCVGNIVGPQVWQAKYAPRYYVPWGVILACYVVCPVLVFTIRTVLVRRNKTRDAAAAQRANLLAQGKEVDVDETFVDVVDTDGTKRSIQVDKGFLDYTDKQNDEYRYAL